ncbi:hypothetical protein J2797_005539 [Paraburkholderia terricola]|nr:hypothetical protein [Paraburkholderia terricola]
MEPDPVMLACDACGKVFQFGPHRYDGRAISMYRITVCRLCWDANWDGWAPHLEEKVTARLREDGSPLPIRNGKERLRRE